MAKPMPCRRLCQAPTCILVSVRLRHRADSPRPPSSQIRCTPDRNHPGTPELGFLRVLGGGLTVPKRLNRQPVPWHLGFPSIGAQGQALGCGRTFPALCSGGRRGKADLGH
jgi:hypothetical protein